MPRRNPHLIDFDGVYNVGFTSNSRRRFCNVEGLAPPALSERLSLSERIVRVQARFVKSSPGCPSDIIIFHVGTDCRTVWIDFLLPPIGISEVLLHATKRMLAKHHPTWRAVFGRLQLENRIVVYPDEIVFANREADFQSQLNVIRELECKWYDEHKGVYCRQLAMIRTILKSMTLPTPPFTPRILASFETLAGDNAHRAIWILQDIPQGFDISWHPQVPSSDGYEGNTDYFDVTRSGDVVEYCAAESREYLGDLVCSSYDVKKIKKSINFYHPSTGELMTCRVTQICSDARVRQLLEERELLSG